MNDSILPLIEQLQGRRVLVLSGAGISTESGIPDYRGPDRQARAPRPIYYREFVDSPEARVRYWARSTLGWPRLASARPNAGHFALARLEATGRIEGIVTQNVDRLHQSAGSRRVLELHGALAEVRCLGCGSVESRDRVQERLLELNPGWWSECAELAPDGDAHVHPERLRGFRVPGCGRCGGVLKPDVVFFGENVPARRVEEAWRRVEGAEVLLVAGSSLTVYSGFRFAAGAAERGMPVAIVNRGSTRGDPLAAVKIDGALGDVLTELAARLGG